jgi:FkbM family methyltransferase
MRQRVLGASRALGVEPQLRTLQRLAETPAQRRNRRDDEHLRVLMAAVLRRDSNAVDIGANVGSVLADICSLAPDGAHIAVEPLADLADALRARFPSVSVHACALSAQSGEQAFVRNRGEPSLSGFRAQSGHRPGATETLLVPVATLDELIPPDRNVALIKVDVEGAEEQVLRGGLRTLRRCRPIVVFEHGASAVRHYGTTHRALHRLLTEEAGLAIFDMDGDGPLPADRFDDVADPPGSRWNFFARPW